MPILHPRQIAGMNIHDLYFSLDYFLDAQQQVAIQSIELWGGSPQS
jgi:protein FrlC